MLLEKHHQEFLLGWETCVRECPPYASLEDKEPLYNVKELSSIAPTDLRQSLDVSLVVAWIVDRSEFDEFKKLHGTTLLTGFARIFGELVGILGNSDISLNESAL